MLSPVVVKNSIQCVLIACCKYLPPSNAAQSVRTKVKSSTAQYVLKMSRRTQAICVHARCVRTLVIFPCHKCTQIFLSLRSYFACGTLLFGIDLVWFPPRHTDLSARVSGLEGADGNKNNHLHHSFDCARSVASEAAYDVTPAA